MKLFYYIRRFWEIPRIERRLLIRSFVISISYRIQVWFLPIRFFIYSPTLKENNIAFYEKYLKDSKKTLSRVHLFSPWLENCLVKALTFRYILNAYGIKSNIIFGIKKDKDNKLMAHAYLSLSNGCTYFRNNSFSDVYKLPF